MIQCALYVSHHCLLYGNMFGLAFVIFWQKIEEVEQISEKDSISKCVKTFLVIILIELLAI